jgi:hypothetical protein
MDRIKEFITNHKKLLIIIGGAILVIGIAVGVIVAVTGKKPANGEAETTTTEAPSETESVTEESTDEKETETEEEVVEYPYTNPLTGEGTMVDYSGTRPVAVMLNTIKQSLPQSGNSKADILIEIAEEGGITRILGIYQDLSGVGTLGAVRSTREYFYSWAQGFDAILVHAGGDSWVLNQIQSDGNNTIDSITRNRGAFWRDQNRLTYLSLEHTLFTSSDNLTNWLANSTVPTTHTKDNYTKLNFTDELPEDFMTEPAKNVKVTFSGYKSTSFKYNETTGKYDVFFWDTEPYMDEASQSQVEVTNVIVLPVPNWGDYDVWGKLRQKYNLSGGVGYYVSGGEYTQINWTKGDYNQLSEYGNPFNMTTLDGEPVSMAAGNTYICVINQAFGVEILGE